MIPLSVPNLSGKEWEYIKDCLDTNWVSSVGSYVDRFEKAVAEYTGARYAVSTVNGTSALHIALLMAGVERGDLVLVPNITFVASVNSILYTGAEPVLVDIDPRTWQMDLSLLEQYLHQHTRLNNGVCQHKETKQRIRAIMPVHVLGNIGNMQQLLDLANRYHLTIIEDSTEALGTRYQGTHAGRFGLAGCFSFNGNKIITTGGGGMLVTDNEQVAKKAKHLTTQAKSDPFEYMHDDAGYNYRLVNILAAMGLAQMEQLDAFIQHKHQVNAFYRDFLRTLDGVQFQEVIPGAEPNDWLFTILHPRQQDLMGYLIQQSIQVRPFWVPMNRLPYLQSFTYVSESDFSFQVYSKGISLPCSTSISMSQLEQVKSAILRFHHEYC
ncbi:MAG: LegC family aminotransferase [Cytophagaceae bacterium]|jgi:perosamine synthetase|nr:LegC family aminotransferase [Cytophagaceae bacterium]